LGDYGISVGAFHIGRHPTKCVVVSDVARVVKRHYVRENQL
jgi:hypothetical protein